VQVVDLAEVIRQMSVQMDDKVPRRHRLTAQHILRERRARCRIGQRSHHRRNRGGEQREACIEIRTREAAQ